MGLLSAVINTATKNISPNSMKGAYVSGVPNYIKGYYGPSEAAKEAGTSAVLKEKAKGFADVIGAGLGNAVKMQLPYNRAVYRDTGVNLPLYKSNKQTPDSKSLQEEMTARALANRHISEQAGRKGPNVLDEVLERSAYSNYIPMEKGFYDIANQFNKGTTKQKITKEESEKLENYMSKIWNTKSLLDRATGKSGKELGFNRDNKFVLKRPQGTISGNHWNDMVNRSVFSNVARDVFGKDKKNPKSVKELAERLKRVKWSQVDKKGNKTERIGVPGIELDKDGVWFSFSKAGSAITEGGVNFRVKLRTDGTGFGVMSDEHNFLEFLPGMSNALPNKVLAATPPMHFNIRQVRPMQTGGFKKGRGRPAKTNIYPNKSWKEFGEEGNQDMMSFIQGQKPSAETLRNERLRAGTKVGLGMLGGSNFLPSSQE